LLAGRKMLVADNSVTVRKIVDLTFSDEGVQVVTATTGDEAVERLGEGDAPDIVLAHVSLPGNYNGYQLCEYVKADGRFRHIPVLLLVGTFEPFNEAEARRVGADDVLTKPFQSIRDLVGRVGSLVSGRKEDREESKQNDASSPERTAESEETHSPAAFAETQEIALPTPPTITTNEERTAFEEERSEPEIADIGSTDDQMIEITDDESLMLEANAPRYEEDERMTPTLEMTTDDFEQPDFVSNVSSDENFFQQTESDADEIEMRASGIKANDDAESFTTQDEQVYMSGDPEIGDSLVSGKESEDVLFNDNDDHQQTAAVSSQPMAEDDTLLDLGDFQSTSTTERQDDFVLDLTQDEFSSSQSQTGLADDETVEMPNPFADEEVRASVVSSDDAVQPAETNEANIVSSASPESFPSPPVFEDNSSLSSNEEGQIPLGQLSPEVIDAIARRAIELLSDRVVREIAWEVVPDLAELIIKRRLEEETRKG
jgi:CheY-like chemotaxis protein